jgi:ATP-dependent DNA helicase RecQ
VLSLCHLSWQAFTSGDLFSELAYEAIQFLRRSDLVIEPRKKWPDKTSVNGWREKIGQELQAEASRALSLWGDEGWGKLVKRGKYTDKSFDVHW